MSSCLCWEVGRCMLAFAMFMSVCGAVLDGEGVLMQRAGMGAVGGASYESLCDGNMWGESGRVGCIRSRV